MRKYSPTDIERALARLAGQVDRIEHELNDLVNLRGDVQAHSRTLTDLADLMRRLRATGGEATAAAPSFDPTVDEADPEAVLEWVTITDPVLAVFLLNDLEQWTRDVWNQYASLPGCWPWHPPVVAELLWCRHLWAAALTPGIGFDALAAWHDRWRPGVAHRVGRSMAACDRAFGAHIAADASRWIPDHAALDEVALWWSSTHGSTPAPGLTREERS